MEDVDRVMDFDDDAGGVGGKGAETGEETPSARVLNGQIPGIFVHAPGESADGEPVVGGHGARCGY